MATPTSPLAPEVLTQFEELKNVLQQLATNLQPIIDVFKEMASKDTGETMKRWKEGLRELRDTVKDAALEGLADIFRPLKGIFEPLKPIIEIFTGLMQALIGEVLIIIMPLMKPIFDLLLQLMPVFKTLGQLVGGFLAWLFGDTGLIFGFQALAAVLKPLGDWIINVFLGIWDALVWVWKNILKPVFDAITLVFKIVANAFIGFFNILNTIVQTVSLGFAKDFSMDFIPLQKGGNIIRDTPAFLHAGEKVVPLDQDRDEEMLDEMRRTRRALESMIEAQQENVWGI